MALGACNPKSSDAPSVQDKIKALEAKTERVVEEKLETLEERFKRERVELSAHLGYHLKRTEERIVEWKKRAETDTLRRPAIERLVVKLEERTKTLREHIAKMNSATADQWDQIREPWKKKQGYEEYENEILKETQM
jgi:hypothetical protein